MADYAKEKGFTLVLDGTEGVTVLPAVIYADDALDITDAILSITAPEAEAGEASE